MRSVTCYLDVAKRRDNSEKAQFAFSEPRLFFRTFQFLGNR